MEVIEAIYARKSIRRFKPDPVSRELLVKVLETARRAPSGMNSQPWYITVVTGETLENLRRENLALLRGGIPGMPEAPHTPFAEQYRRRQVAIAIQLFQLMGIAREDKQGRTDWQERGFRYFDAPAALILSMDKELGNSTMSIMDIGSLYQTICLAAVAFGLGTCIEDQGVMYPEVVRRYTGIPDSRRLMISIAIGYPDWDFPANRVQSTREPLENNVTWCDGK